MARAAVIDLRYCTVSGSAAEVTDYFKRALALNKPGSTAVMLDMRWSNINITKLDASLLKEAWRISPQEAR